MADNKGIKAIKRFEWAINFLIVRRRFVHQILGMMKKTPMDKIETMGVRVTDDGRFELLYNVEWVDSLSDEELVYVLYHEVLHLALHHCTSRKFDDHQLGNIATDLAVNELIKEDDGCKIPRVGGKIMGVLVDEMKKEKMFHDMESRQTAEWYYDYLRKRAPKIEITIEGPGGQGDPKDGKGGQGEGKDQKDGKGGGSGQKDKAGQGGKIKIKVTMLDEHGNWKEHDIADERVRAKIKEIDLMDMWGDVPGTDKEAILAAQVKRINWRSFIRMFCGNILWKDREATRKRPNRRTGYIHPGGKRVHVDKILVAIDDSGSIDSELLSQFLGTLNTMVDFFPIDLVVFDTQIQMGPKPFTHKKVKIDFTGRGGTDFQAVVDLAVKNRYKGLIILTDGCAPAPSKPAGCRVLWALCAGAKAPVDWGLKVQLKK